MFLHFEMRTKFKQTSTKGHLIEFEEFLWLPKLFYKLVGINFLQISLKSRLQNFLNVYLACSITSHLICVYYLFKLLAKLVQHGDIPNVILVTPYGFFLLDSSVKFLALGINMGKMRKIYRTLKRTYPTVSEQQIYQVNQHYLPKWVRYTIYCYVAVCIFLIYSPVIISTFLYAYDVLIIDKKDATFAYLKTYPITYDFDYRTPLRYSMITVIEVLNANLSLVGSLATDLWLICYTAQICMHLDYIRRVLEQYEPRVENMPKDCEFLAEIIRKHQVMLSLHNEINRCFGIGNLFHLMSTIIIICNVAVQLVIAEEVGLEFLKNFTFIITASGQFYLVCYYGQRLINTSQQIAVAAFSQKWFRGSKKYKKLLLLIIMRAQKQAELSAMGFQSGHF